MAVSGIDNTIKIFSPDNRAQHDAAAGINISRFSNDSSGYSSGQHQRNGRHGARREEQEVHGLASRKRMQDQYTITSRNDAERQGGMRDAFITVRPDGNVARLRTVQIPFTVWLGLFTS
jgi:nuclear receptor interaction protein